MGVVIGSFITFTITDIISKIFSNSVWCWAEVHFSAGSFWLHKPFSIFPQNPPFLFLWKFPLQVS